MPDPFENFVEHACDHGEASELLDALLADPEEHESLEHAEIERIIRDKWEREAVADWRFVRL